MRSLALLTFTLFSVFAVLSTAPSLAQTTSPVGAVNPAADALKPLREMLKNELPALVTLVLEFPSVRREIKLTGQQAARVKAGVDAEVDRAAQSLRAEAAALGSIPEAERPQKLDAILKRVFDSLRKTAVEAILGQVAEEQKLRLMQVFVWTTFPRCLLEGIGSDALRLTEAQKAGVRAAIKAHGRALDEARDPMEFDPLDPAHVRAVEAKDEAAFQTMDRSILSLLSTEQRRLLESLRGPRFRLTAERAAL